MVQEKDTLAVLAKIVLKHSTSIQAMAHLLGDAIHSVVAGLNPCLTEGCNEPATVCHKTLKTAFCDRHAASSIVNARKPGTGTLRETISDEDSWEDVHNAESIRHLMEYVELTREAEARRYVPLH